MHIIACWTVLMLHQFYTLNGKAKPFFGLVIWLFNFIRLSVLSWSQVVAYLYVKESTFIYAFVGNKMFHNLFQRKYNLICSLLHLFLLKIT